MIDRPTAIAAMAFALWQHPPVQLTPEQIRSFDPVGYCVNDGQEFDVGHVMMLENRSITVDGPSGPRQISIHGEDLHIQELTSDVDARTIIDVDSTIDMRDDLDIELKLAYFNNRLSLYWKETFQHRFYRQGLFYIEGTELEFLCAGQGGRHVER